jgi:hypothetical protein
MSSQQAFSMIFTSKNNGREADIASAIGDRFAGSGIGNWWVSG